MDSPPLPPRLSQIQTSWSLVQQAHSGEVSEVVSVAQQALLQRYGGAAHRYLLAAMRDTDLADELFQDFAVRFLRGDFHRANPARGRFRDFIKTALLNLIVDHHRRQRTKLRPVADGALEALGAIESPDDFDHDFAQGWREEILVRAWESLADFQKQSGNFYYVVLRYRAEHPEMRSNPMAEALSQKLGRAVTAAWVRQTLHRAREKFAELVVAEVARSLEGAPVDQLEEELGELELLEYCRPALERRSQADPP